MICWRAARTSWPSSNVSVGTDGPNSLREVKEGARIEFNALSEFSLSLARESHGVPVVSPPRLYADLQALGGRGEEAAEHVRQELIRV